MIQLVIGQDKEVAHWVQQQYPQIASFDPCTALGVADGNKLIAGIVYYNYHGHMLDVSIAAIDPRWCNRRILRAFFSYPFKQLGVRRVQITVPKRDKRNRRNLERFGFKFEGKRRAVIPDGSDAIEYSMLRHEAERWLTKEAHDESRK